MSDAEKSLIAPSDELFARVAAILEAARGNVVRAVNTNMVVAYWLVGREIVEGFSVPNLQRFRRFYLAYPRRGPIWSPSGTKSLGSTPVLQKSSPPGTKSGPLAFGGSSPEERPFAPELTWSHYRALAHVDNEHARDFYEREAIECGWSKAQLERQIQSSLYQRILANRGEDGLTDKARERLPGEPFSPRDILRSPLVLEFLQLPDTPSLHESSLEQAIIDNLQTFMLELGKGFSFVARQKHIRFDDDDFYIDLVFYNYLLKCFLQPHPLLGQERIRRKILRLERRQTDLRRKISAAAPDRRRAGPRTRKGASPPRRKERGNMSERIVNAPEQSVRLFGGGALNWSPARARRGGDVGGWALRCGVEDVQEVRS